MGMPQYLLENPRLLADWIERGAIALREHDMNENMAEEVAVELASMWHLGQSSGESSYFQMLAESDRGEIELERMFWEIAERVTIKYADLTYVNEFEVLRSVQDYTVDEWGLEA